MVIMGYMYWTVQFGRSKSAIELYLVNGFSELKLIYNKLLCQGY